MTNLAAILAAAAALLAAIPILANAYYKPQSRASNITLGLIFLFVSIVFFAIRKRL